MAIINNLLIHSSNYDLIWDNICFHCCEFNSNNLKSFLFHSIYISIENLGTIIVPNTKCFEKKIICFGYSLLFITVKPQFHACE